AGDHPARGLQPGEAPVGQVVAVQLVARLVRVGDQQRGPVRVPGRADLAGQVEDDLLLTADDRVPDEQLVAAAPLVVDQEPRVPLDGGEPGRVHALAGTVPQVGDGGAVGPDDAQRHVAAVAVLAVADGDQALAAGQRGDVRVLRVVVDDLGRGARLAQVDRGAVVGAAPDHGEAGAAQAQARRVRRFEVGDGGDALGALLRVDG